MRKRLIAVPLICGIICYSSPRHVCFFFYVTDADRVVLTGQEEPECGFIELFSSVVLIHTKTLLIHKNRKDLANAQIFSYLCNCITIIEYCR